jgi:hypothetical protein
LVITVPADVLDGHDVRKELGLYRNVVPVAKGPSRTMWSMPWFQVGQPATSSKKGQMASGVALVSALYS